MEPENKNEKDERLTPEKAAGLHLHDPSHHITDQDIKNLIVGVDAMDEEEVKATARAKLIDIENQDLPTKKDE